MAGLVGQKKPLKLKGFSLCEVWWRRRESNPPSLVQVIEINNEIFNRFLLETVWKPFSKDGSKENSLKEDV